ncbi:MAG TPA: (d)CMP kinase [Fervidobacterium sp.]|nr:(d)CMP kinase [Fervidobacterium sp.]HOK87400.1 (d)CMP kinase [Fervidobacterium sp.]HOM73564.1 (d)CMP kinase [Fervidobacterium sp.]HOQ39079.1 (d)CMP kinase [Fervidobacterium sp.]HPP17481.1 (d)CMP kinase [Fervidobacterium sp.]
MHCKIAIDGPAGSGKTTVAKLIAQRLSIDYLDTGAMYRMIGLVLHNLGASAKEASLKKYLEHIKIKYDEGKFYLNGQIVGDEIRTPEAGMYASDFASHNDVREFLTQIQKEICKNRSIVAEGRDIGTVVIPDANVKIFLVASPEVRARRRYDELKNKGIDVKYEDLLEQIIERDKNDSTRDIAPLVKAGDAIEIDTSNLTVEQVVDRIIEIVKERCKL